MIKYIPIRNTPSACLKDELTFDSMADLVIFVSDLRSRISRYIGLAPVLPDQILVEDLHLDDPRIGLKHVCRISIVRSDVPQCVGYCGE